MAQPEETMTGRPSQTFASKRFEALAVTLPLCLLLTAGCSDLPPELVLSGPTMGTTYSVKVVSVPSSIGANELRVVVDGVLADVDRAMSGYRSDSEISRFNAAASTEWFEVSPDVARVASAALEVSRLTSGAFDITVAPLVEAWGFGAAGEPSAPPDDEALARIAASIGYQKLHVRGDPPALKKDVAQLTVDLNAIAPGFAVDRLADRFLSMGIENFLVDIGGEVRARGRNVRGEPWRVAVERPVDSEQSPYAILQLRDAAVATSGEYRHYRVREGRRYSHTIDPRTLRPIEHELGSVVVVGSESMYADAWATALNVLGVQEGYALALRQGLAAMFIEKRGGQWQSRATPEFEPYLARHRTR